MKKLFVAVCLSLGSWSAVAVDAPVSFDFAAVPVQAFMTATYRNLLQRDFVISPEVLGMDKKISISVKSVAVAELPAFVDGILASQGVLAVKRGAVYYVDVDKSLAASPEASGAFSGRSGRDAHASFPLPVAPDVVHRVFKPMNRPVDFMVAVLNSAFAGGLARPAGAQIVIAAPEDRIKAVLALAAELDIAPRTVEVSASFVEVSRLGSSSRGLSVVASVLGARFGATLGAGTGALSIKGGSFELVLDALAADGRFKQVSNSRVVGDESERMSLTVGDETPTLQSTGRDNQGNGTTTIVYRTSGVILDVLPRVLGSGRVAMAVDGQISSFQATMTGVTGSPTLVKRQVKTAVTVGDSEVLIIGGLDDSKVTDNRTGLSFLPKSWSANTGSDLKSDLVLILSAKILASK